MDHETAQGWLDRYVAAWKSYDADDIAGLFSDDVRYRYYPYAVWIVGRDAVVASWLAEDTDAQGSTVTWSWRPGRRRTPRLRAAR